MKSSRGDNAKGLLKLLFSWVSLMLAVYIVGMGSFLLYTTFQTSPRSWPKDEFSPESWESAVPQERYRLVRDLLDGKRLLSMSRSQILDLLGEPDSQWPEGRQFNYTLKNRDGYEWDFNAVYFLAIDFDSNDLVVKAEIRAD